MDNAMRFLGGLILICLGISALCIILLAGFGIYMEVHDCPANYVKCGIFPIESKL